MSNTRHNLDTTAGGIAEPRSGRSHSPADPVVETWGESVQSIFDSEGLRLAMRSTSIRDAMPLRSSETAGMPLEPLSEWAPVLPWPNRFKRIIDRQCRPRLAVRQCWPIFRANISTLGIWAPDTTLYFARCLKWILDDITIRPDWLLMTRFRLAGPSASTSRERFDGDGWPADRRRCFGLSQSSDIETASAIYTPGCGSVIAHDAGMRRLQRDT